MSKQSESLEGLHLSILEKWASNGKVDTLPEEMNDYLDHLRAALGFHNRGYHKTQIIKRLQLNFGLNYSQAKSRFVDACNHFYLDNDIKYDAYMNIYADKLDKMADLIIQTARSSEEILLALKPTIEAAKIREKIKPKDTIPKEFFDRPFKVYTTKLEELGVHESIDRNLLSKMIDTFNIDESDKIRVKQEAGEMPKQLFSFSKKDTYEQDNQN